MGWSPKYAARIEATQAKLGAVVPMDWGRLAAYIDGEGHVGIGSNGRGYQTVRLSITSTDPRLPKWLVETFGGTVTTVKRQSWKWKIATMWSTSTRHAESILRQVRPLLIIKGEQADVVLALRDRIQFGRNTMLSDEEKVYRLSLKEQITQLNCRGERDKQG